MSKRLIYVLCGTALVFDAGVAHAQATGQASSVGEIIVTARKRTETLQSAPVAVSAVTAQELKNHLVTDLSKIGELAPQVTMVQAGTGTGAIIAIRGVASASGDAGLDQSVALDFDGVPLSRGRIMAASLFDTASVQVLPGPQALYFGKNSPAGVISIRTQDPGDHLEGYVTPGYEFVAHERFLEGAISGPLTDTLRARIAFRADDMRGWIKNIAEPHPDVINPSITDPGATWGRWGPDTKNLAARLTLAWAPTQDFDAKLKVTLDQQNSNAGLANSEPFCINGQTQPLQAGKPIPDSDCSKNRVKGQGSVAPQYAVGIPYANGGVPYFKSDFGLVSLNLNKRFDHFSLTSTTGYYSQTTRQANNTDWSPYSIFWASQKEGYRLATQELRANSTFSGPVNVMAGVYFETYSRPFLNAPDLSHVFNPAAGNYATNIMSSHSKGTYTSAFAQATWAITPELELSGGARWSHDHKTISIVNLVANPAMPTLLPQGQDLNGRYSDDHVSPEVTLTWRPNTHHTLYAAFKTGYKSGGLSNPFLPLATQTSQGLVFKPETAQGGEIGYKARILDGQMRFDVTAYRYEYQNLQVVAFTPPASYVLQNAASSRISGVQGAAEWLATSALTLHGNFGWNNAKYRNFPLSPCYQGQTAAAGCVGGVQDLSGKPMFDAPKLTFNLGGDYRLPVLAGWASTVTAQATHSSSYNAATDASPGGHQDAYWLADASLRTGPENGRYELALIGRNLTNTYYLVNVNGWSGSGNSNQYVGYFNRPREVVLQATYRW